MNFKSLDFLSPDITLFHNYQKAHVSTFSGILTILAYLICIIISIYFSTDFFLKKNPICFYYKKFNIEAGFFPLNESSMYHFLELTNDGKIINFDSKKIRIIGFRKDNAYFLSPSILNNSIHWIYDFCSNSDILFKRRHSEIFSSIESFSKHICIKYMFDPSNNKYYEVNENDYESPYLIHGNANLNNLEYSIIIELCRNDSFTNNFYGKNSCSSQDEIEKYVSNISGGSLYVIDHYINISNYYEPWEYFLQRIPTAISKGISPVYNLNFSPISLITHSGVILEKKYYSNSYIFDENQKTSIDDSGDINILCEFKFWIQNNFNVYERKYIKLLDVLADVGGIIKTIIAIFTLINKIYNNYVIIKNLSDYIIVKNKNLKFNLINQLSQIETNMYQNFIPNKTKNSETFNNNKINTFLQNNYMNPKGVTMIESSNNRFLSKIQLTNLKNNKIKVINSVIERHKIKSELDIINKFSFVKYIYEIIKGSNVHNTFKLLLKFRMKLLSEEHLFQNHLNVFSIEKRLNYNGQIIKCDLKEIYNEL